MTSTPQTTPNPGRNKAIGLGILAAVVLGGGAGGWFLWTGADKRAALPDPGTPSGFPAPAPAPGTNPGTPGNSNPTAQRPLPPPGAGQANEPGPTPEAVDQIITAAGQLQQQGEANKAEAILTEAVRNYPDQQRLRLTLADFYVAQKRPAEAYAEKRLALELGPRDANIEFEAGTLASMLGKLSEAADHYDFAQQKDPTNPEIPLYLAQVQVKLNRIDAAKASLARAGRLTPERAVVWGTLAEISLRENNVPMALQHVAKARSLEPRSTGWRLIESRALRRDGRAEEALTLLLGLDAAEQRDLSVLRSMAECYGMLKRPNDAAAKFAAASDALPADPDLALEAALWAERTGDKSKAQEFARRAKDLGNTQADTVLSRLAAAPTPEK